MARQVQRAAAEPIEEPWALPDGWRWERLGGVGDWGSGGTPDAKTPSFYGGGIPWYRSGELEDKPLGEPELTITEEGLRKSSAKIVGPNAVLIAMYGATVGKAAITTQPCTTNQAVAFCQATAAIADPRFIFYFIINIRRQLRGQAQGGAQPNISQGLLKAQLIPLPPLQTQRRIVNRIEELFTEIDDGEAALERARGDLATWRKALLKAAVTGELTADWRAANPPTETGADFLARILAERRTRWLAEPRNKAKRYVEPAPPAHDRLATLPHGWAEATVEQVAFVENGQTPKGIELIVSESGETPWFKVSSMNAEGNSDKLISSNWRLDRDQARRIGLRVHPEDTIVFPKRGGSIFTEKKRRLGCPGAIDLNVMAVIPAEPVKEYLWTFFQGVSLTAISDGSNVPQINYDDVSTLVVPLPPPNEGGEIADRVRETLLAMHLMRAELEEQAEASVALRQSILAAAFRGELVA